MYLKQPTYMTTTDFYNYIFGIIKSLILISEDTQESKDVRNLVLMFPLSLKTAPRQYFCKFYFGEAQLPTANFSQLITYSLNPGRVFENFTSKRLSPKHYFSNNSKNLYTEKAWRFLRFGPSILIRPQKRSAHLFKIVSQKA